jgi:eukaryotic-like serine/threonine-protein kinase
MTKKTKKVPLKMGARLDDNLTVISVIDGGSVDPVYLVWHKRDWCPLACKVMQSPHRAKSEFDVLSCFAHPNIVRPIGISGQVNLLMPFVEGTLLSDAIDIAPRHRLSVSDTMRLAIYVGAALTHVHTRGFLHMDVKPDNIIVGVDGRPMLFDFGSARRIGGERPNTYVGTNVFIAPEECSLGPVGTGADIFSLAVTIYEMLTGKVPFGRDTPDNPFPQLSRDATPMKTYRQNVPRGLENLIIACLERNPAFRPELAEILPMLHSFIEHGPPMWPPNLELGSGHGVPERAAVAPKAEPARQQLSSRKPSKRGTAPLH